jgi:hypothetical protein
MRPGRCRLRIEVIRAEQIAHRHSVSRQRRRSAMVRASKRSNSSWPKRLSAQGATGAECRRGASTYRHLRHSGGEQRARCGSATPDLREG